MIIKASSTISFQPTFQNPGFHKDLKSVDALSMLKAPDYGQFISAMDRRRMSDVIKIAVTCAKDCTNSEEVLDAIIVGTSLGSGFHTAKFLDIIKASEGSLISPTSFTLSTANTLAGQISLQLKNHGYNNTHTQNSLSFEHALIDAQLCVAEGMQNILVGAADEWGEHLYNMAKRLNKPDIISTFGSSFFRIASGTTTSNEVSVVDVEAITFTSGIEQDIGHFLNANALSHDEIDYLLFGTVDNLQLPVLSRLFPTATLIDYVDLCGAYLTNAGFAMAYGVDLLNNGMVNSNKRNQSILICNNLIPENLGLILLRKH